MKWNQVHVVVISAVLCMAGLVLAQPAGVDPKTGVPNFPYVRSSMAKAFDLVTEAIRSNEDAKIKASEKLILEMLKDQVFCGRHTVQIKKNVDNWLKELIKLKRNKEVESIALAAIGMFKSDAQFVATCEDRRKMDPGKPQAFVAAGGAATGKGKAPGELPALGADGVPNAKYVAGNIPRGMTILTDMVKSGDEARIHKAMSVLSSVFADPVIAKKTNPFTLLLNVDEWLKELYKQKRYDDVEKLAVITMCAFPHNLTYFESFQEHRIHAKLAQGKPNEALILSKSFYNICRMSNTGQAVNLVSECLQTVHKDKDPQVTVKQFKLQQLLGAVPPSPASASQLLTAPKEQSSIFKNIKIDPTPYQNAIDVVEANFGGIAGLIAKGNLLLLADKPAEALILFEKAYKTATDAKDFIVAAEGMARAMRAEDGSIGRANAWVLSLRQTTGK